MLLVAIIILLFSAMFLYYKEISENFLNNCDDKLYPLHSISCTDIPNHPIKYENTYIPNTNNMFENIVPRKGKFTFKIPELKYDGIFSRDTSSCDWNFNNNTKLTYGTNNYLHVPLCMCNI